LSSLIPAGLVVESIAESDEKITVMVRSAVQEDSVPGGGVNSGLRPD
jgi:hypothetical protein